MHPDIHLLAEHCRAAELRSAARTPRVRRRPARLLRHQLGWTLVEMGLRLVQTGRSGRQPAVSQARS